MYRSIISKSTGKKHASPRINGLVILFALLSSIIVALWGANFAQAAPIVQTYYVPITEPQARTWMNAQTSTVENDTIHSVISITGTYNGTTVYYDHWEDGYEEDITNPQQSTTEVLTINAGQVITLADDIPVANGIRDQGNIYHDGMDKISGTQQIVVTRALWPNGAPQAIGTQMAGAVEVFETGKWGKSFEVPVGINNTYASFNYTALSVVAQKNGTSVTVQNSDLSVNVTQTLNEGQTLYVEGIKVGATITSSGGPVQVDMLTAHAPSQYDGRLYSLLPIANLGNTYYSPVSTTHEAGGANVINTIFAYNPNNSTIQVNITCMAGTTGCPASQNLAAHTAGFFPLPWSPTPPPPQPGTLTGAKLSSTGGEPFYALAVIDINGTVHNWGFNMIPETSLTTSVVVGWSPGTTDKQRDANPVWVTPARQVGDPATTIYVDYDGNPATGPLIDPLGNHYNVAFVVQPLQSQKIFSPGPAGSYDHTGWRVYTTDNTRIAVVYGQDGASSSANQPTELDLGTTVLPFPSLVAYKSAELIGDFNNNGGIDPGELLQYTIKVHNSGIVPISNINLQDSLDPNTIYVANTTTMDGTPIPDNPSDPRFPLGGTGYNIPSTLQPGQDIFFIFQSTVNPSIPLGTSELINNARVSSVAEIFLNAKLSLIQQGILQVSKSSSIAPNKVKPGENIDYTITVTNISSTPQTGIQVDDLLPDGTSYVANSTTVTGHRQKLVMDKFNKLLYGNNDGPENWTSSWVESPADGPTAGNVQVINGALRLTAAGSSAKRTADLTTGITGQNFTSATLSFDFRTGPGVASTDQVVVEVSNGVSGPFTILETFQTITGQTTGTRSYNISAYISATTTVQFRIINGYSGAGKYFYLDNIAIKTNELSSSVTKDNITGGANPDLKNGVPPALLRQDDGFSLAAGENMTITYRVQANNPVNEARIVNTATATSYEKAPPASSTTIDPVSSGGTIGGLVWLDSIINGAHDYGEPGLYNVRVWLDTNNNNVFDSGVDFETRTGTDGKYVFDGLLPGTYKVFVDETTIPAGLSRTTGTINPSATITITGEDTVLSTDFGYKTANSGVAIIGNYIWSDANNNGVQDSGEVGIGGVTVDLRTSPGGLLVQTATTNAFGIYLFTNVSAGTHTVTVTDTASKLSGYSPTTGPQSLGKGIGIPSDPLTVTGGNSYMMMDFGYRNPSLHSISNKLWSDSDNDGSLDTGEPGMKDITIILLDSNGFVMGAAVSDVNGEFSFTGVPNGNYTIRIEDATGKLIGYAGTTPAAQNGLLSVTVAGSNVSGVSFGYNGPGRIGDIVWRDLNRNGIQDSGEAGIQGVSVRLYKDTNGDGLFNPAVDQLIATTTTNSAGNYMFQVTEAGRFFVSIDNSQPALSGLTLTTRDEETYQGVQIQVDFLNLNTSLLTADFGFSTPAIIGGAVWDDTNRNAAQNSGEPSIQGVSVKLYKDTNGDGVFNPAADQLVSTLITDSNGNYAFPVSESGRFFISIDANQTPLLGMTLTTNDDQTYQGAQITVNLPDVNTFYMNGNFGYATLLPSALSVTKTANPSGDVFAGDAITYTIAVTNTSPTRQTGITINDLLPANTAYTAYSTSATGPAAATSTTSDDFETNNYTGGTGNWVGSWREIGENNGSALDNVRIIADLGDYSARIRRQSNYGLERTVNLSSCSSASLSFNYRRNGLEAGKTVRVYAYNGTVETQLWDSGSSTDAAYLQSPSLNIPYLLANSIIRFRSSSGWNNNNDQFNFDNVQIICNIPKTIQTKTNQVGSTNPLVDGVPPNLVVPADGFILDQNDTLTVTFWVAVNNPLPLDVDSIINQAIATSNESGPAIGYAVNSAPLLHDLKVTKTINAISNPCTVGTCQLTYLVTVTNVGRNAETNVQVTDNLPSQLQYLSSTPSQGTYNNITGIWSVGNLSSGNSATLLVTATVTGSGSSIQNCASLTASTPVDTNPGNNTGCVSITPTYIFLSDFRAYEDNGRMVIEWTTSSENGTAGFYLFRKDDSTGTYRRMNRRLLPALLTSLQGGTYSLIDNGASPDKSYTYVLIEIENRGARNVYGPYTVKAGGPGDLENPGILHSINPGALLNAAEETNRSTERIAKNITKDGDMTFSNKIEAKPADSSTGRDLFSNYTRKANEPSPDRKARLEELKEITKAAPAVNKAPYSTMIKIPINKDGLYYLDALKISNLLGLPKTSVVNMIAHNGLVLSNQGNKVSYTPSDGNSGMLFYGQGMHSIYTDENMYWLSPGTGLQMEVVGRNEPTPSLTNSAFTESLHAEENKIAVPSLFSDPEADYWFWDYIVSGDPEDGIKTFTVRADGLADTSSPATIAVTLFGFTNTKHHAIVTLKNGTVIGEDRWEGTGPRTLITSFDQGLLHEGSNDITVEGSLDDDTDYDIFHIDSFDLTYQRLYHAAGNTLAFRGNQNPVVTVTGFTNAGILLFDLTDLQKPELVKPTTINNTNGDYNVSFTPACPSSLYLALTADAVTTVTDVRSDDRSNLKTKNNFADYLIITVPEMRETAKSLANYRKNQRLTPMIVVLDDIMDEFNYGIYNPKAIRDFLSYAFKNWLKPPKYVLFIGNGTFDYKNTLGKGDNLIPTLMGATPDGLYPSDNLFADFTGDHVPEIAVGRLPVLTASDLQNVINKIIGYERSAGNYIIMVADSPDDGGDFPSDSDRVASLLTQGNSVDRIYLSQHPTEEARTLLMNGINKGAVFLNYIGHGGVDILARSGVLLKGDVDSMKNSGKLPVMAAMTCSAGQYAIPGFDTLSEVMIVKKDVGAAAVWAPTGLSLNSFARTLDEEFCKAAFGKNKVILGDVILKAFRSYSDTGSPTYMMDIYTLLGDPALKMRQIPYGISQPSKR